MGDLVPTVPSVPNDPQSLLVYAFDNDIRLWVEGDRIRYYCESENNIPGFVARLREHKPELMAILSANTSDAIDFPPVCDPQDSDLETDPGITVPASGWRWIVATWKPIRWRSWHDHALALMPPNATAEEIIAAQYRAFLDLASVYELNHADLDQTGLLDALTDRQPDPFAAIEAEAIRWANQ